MSCKGNKPLRALAIALIAALLMAALPCAALAESYSAMVKSKAMYVAKDAKGKKPLGKLAKDTVVTVLAQSNGVARIKYNGRTGYALASDLVSVESVAEKAVASVDTRVYKKPNAKSASVKVKKGTSMYVLAVKGDVAMVERGGAVGYARRSHLLLEGEEPENGQMSPEDLEKLKEQLENQQKQEEAQQPKAPTLMEAYKSGKYSNEQICYLFLTQMMGYNTAAAAAVLANINYESGFSTTLNGDGGTSYGICQWHASRKTRLASYCEEHGMPVDSLPGQLLYLKYELETYYPKVHRYMKGVANTAEGAYDAAYYFCYNFEGPAARESQSIKRGQSAQKTYFPRYA